MIANAASQGGTWSAAFVVPGERLLNNGSLVRTDANGSFLADITNRTLLANRTNRSLFAGTANAALFADMFNGSIIMDISDDSLFPDVNGSFPPDISNGSLISDTLVFADATNGSLVPAGAHRGVSGSLYQALQMIIGGLDDHLITEDLPGATSSTHAMQASVLRPGRSKQPVKVRVDQLKDAR